MACLNGLKPVLGMLDTEFWNIFLAHGLTVIPLLFLMGQIYLYSGVNERLHSSANACMWHTSGNLANVQGPGLRQIRGYPRLDYDHRCHHEHRSDALDAQVQVSSPPGHRLGAHGLLPEGSQPPSLALIIYGLQTSCSICKLLWASVISGLLPVLLTMVLLCRFRPQWGPAGSQASLSDRPRSLPGSLKMLVLFDLVMGGLFAGFFTPTEVGAAGSIIVLLLIFPEMVLWLPQFMD